MDLSGIRKLFNNLTGLTLYKILPFGVDEFQDIQIKTGYKIQTIFDVGANIGQSALHFRSKKPKSRIYSFEPVQSTFELLKKNSENIDVSCFNEGMGASVETRSIQKDGTKSEMNRIVNSSDQIYTESQMEKISINTIDNFCEKNNIQSIDYLKIDTEGFDLEVLKGAKQSLAERKIAFIEVEVGMSPKNTYHVNIMDVYQYMSSYNYYIFGIYEQVQEWKEKIPVLRRSNIVFVSDLVPKKSK